MASLDMSKMYTNIPTNVFLHIIENACKNDDLIPSKRQEILRLNRFIVTQNYFKFQDKTYLQNNGLAMGAPQLLRPIRDLFTVHGNHQDI
jgi:hypothetical protein